MIVSTKHCGKCREEKAITDFSATKGRVDGLNCYCRECQVKINHTYYMNHREKMLGKALEYQKENREDTNRKNRKWNKENRVKVCAKQKEWLMANKEKSRKYSRDGSAKRRATLWGNIENRVNSGLHRSLKSGKNGKWADIVGFGVGELKSHLEKQFTNGMNWERFMGGEIHIDHKIPVTAFHFSSVTDSDFRRCWSLSNLQPLWAFDNRSKNNKIDKSFQPSLL